MALLKRPLKATFKDINKGAAISLGRLTQSSA